MSQRDLRSTIQRLETVNGELQAANEELLTANEELQSSTEELQSVNEELYTVNTEHQLKLDELTTMTNDLSNFLSSTMIGILFVDSNLNIRKFTEYVGREFQLMEHDVGRTIQIFAHSFPDEAIEADCRTVLRDLISIDREVTAMNGRFYTLRIAPYRTTENNIRGLVITIIDSLGSGPAEPGVPPREGAARLPPRRRAAPAPAAVSQLPKTAKSSGPAPGAPARFSVSDSLDRDLDGRDRRRQAADHRPGPGPAPSPRTAAGPPPGTAPPARGAAVDPQRADAARQPAGPPRRPGASAPGGGAAPPPAPAADRSAHTSTANSSPPMRPMRLSRPKPSRRHPGRLPQRPVPLGVAVGVVDRLEAVQIHHDEAPRRTSPCRSQGPQRPAAGGEKRLRRVIAPVRESSRPSSAMLAGGIPPVSALRNSTTSAIRERIPNRNCTCRCSTSA